MKKIFLLASFFVLGGLGFVYYLWNKPHRDPSNEAAFATVSATELYKEYQNNDSIANSKYLDKTIKVYGTIEELKKDQKGDVVVYFNGDDMFGVSCTLAAQEKDKAATLKTGDNISLKGICTGGGEMMDAVIIKCEIVE